MGSTAAHESVYTEEIQTKESAPSRSWTIDGSAVYTEACACARRTSASRKVAREGWDVPSRGR